MSQRIVNCSARARVLLGLGAPLALAACTAFDPDLIEPDQRFATQGAFEAPDSKADAALASAGANAKPAVSDDVEDAGSQQEPLVRDAQSGRGSTTNDAGDDPPAPTVDDTDEPGDATSVERDAEVACSQNDGGSGDRDGDGVGDCDDLCPDDAAKSAPELCGCGVPETDDGTVASCAGLRDALVHRYVFDGSGSEVHDARGAQHGTAVGAELDASGSLTLAGDQSDQYVDLPNGILGGLTDATFEAWVRWGGTGDWTRIFDFGESDVATEGTQGIGKSYLMLCPYASGAETMRAAYADNGPDSAVFVDAPVPLPSSGTHHVALVFDDGNDVMQLYLDGQPQGAVLMTGSLASIRDVNNWLGRSQYVRDPELDGTLYEFRIYDVALSAEQLALSYAGGQNPRFLAE